MMTPVADILNHRTGDCNAHLYYNEETLEVGKRRELEEEKVSRRKGKRRGKSRNGEKETRREGLAIKKFVSMPNLIRK